ncbi:MAG: hypothetical protein RIR96_1384 [Bacteroidota bacterium]
MNQFKYILFFICLFTGRQVFSQSKKIQVKCDLLWNDSDIQLNRYYAIGNNSDSVSFSKIKFYISNIQLISEKSTYNQKQVYLVDAEQLKPIELHIPDDFSIKKIGLLLGTDSLTNVSGASDGDLDPLKGMYWTWQSGYINVKLEGMFVKQDGEEEPFRYHLGGYRNPHVANKSMFFSIGNTSDETKLSVNLSSFIQIARNNQEKNIMSPGNTAVELIHLFADGFQIH